MMDPAQAFSSGFDNSFDQSRSLAAASQARAQNQSQFDIIQHLNQQKFALDQQTSLAQVAAINADTQVKTLQAQELQRQAGMVAPTQQAGVDFQNIASNAANNSADPSEFDRNIQAGIANNPDIVKNFQGGIQGFNSAVIQQKNAFLNKQSQILLGKQANSDLETRNNAASLGLNMDDYLKTDSNGNPTGYDMNLMRADVADAQTEKEKTMQSFASGLKQKERTAEISQVYEGKENVAKINSSERYDARIAGIKQADKKLQATTALNELNGALKVLNKAESPTPQQVKDVQDAKSKLDNIMQGSGPSSGGSVDWKAKLASLPSNQPTFAGPDGKTYNNPNYKP